MTDHEMSVPETPSVEGAARILQTPLPVGGPGYAGHATPHVTMLGNMTVPSIPDLSGFREVGQVRTTMPSPKRLKSRAAAAEEDLLFTEPTFGVESVVVFTDGGWGDHVLFSCAARALYRRFPDLKQLRVFSVFPDALTGVRHITDLRDLGQMHGYEEHRDWAFFKTSVYGNVDFIKHGWHYAQCFCACCGTTWDGRSPEYVITRAEFEEAQRLMASFPRPVVMLHTQSSVDPKFNQVSMFNKNYPIEGWQVVCAELQRLGFMVLIAGHPWEGYHPQTGQPLYQGQFVRYLNHPERKDLTPRKVVACLPFCTAFLESQSHWQHVAAAIGRPGVCMFGHDAPWWTGWPLHTNLYKGPHWDDTRLDDNEKDAREKLFCCPCGRPEGQLGDVCMWDGQQVAWFCGDRPCVGSIQPDELINGVIDLHNRGEGYDFSAVGGPTWGGRKWVWYADLQEGQLENIPLEQLPIDPSMTPLDTLRQLPGGRLLPVNDEQRPSCIERRVRVG